MIKLAFENSGVPLRQLKLVRKYSEAKSDVSPDIRGYLFLAKTTFASRLESRLTEFKYPQATSPQYWGMTSCKPCSLRSPADYPPTPTKT